jgi:hypothetical protein
MSQTIHFAAPVELQAAADGKSPRRFTSTAYTGGALKVSGYPLPIVVDLAGLSTRNNVTANLDHDSSKRVGHVTATENDGRKLLLSGVVSAANSAADEFVSSHDRGYPWQASIEAAPETVDEIQRGKTVKVNGQHFEGPLLVARKAALSGIAFVPNGADDNTSVAIAAKLKGQFMGVNQSFDTWVQSTGLDVSLMTAEQLAGVHANYEGRSNVTDADRSATATMIVASAAGDPVQGEHRRLQQIDAATRGEYGDAVQRVHELKAQAVGGSLSVEQLIQAMREIRMEKLMSTIPLAHTVHRGGAAGVTRETIEASLLIRAGHQPLAEKSYSPQVLDSTRGLRAASLVDLCAHCAQHEGLDTGGMNRHELIRAAFSTTSLPTALSNVMGKVLMDSYKESTANWRGFVKVLPAADFKPQVGVRPSFVGQLLPIGADGEVKHGQLSESTYPWQIGTFAGQLQLSRQDIINDDLQFIQQTMPLMGKSAARSLNDLIWSTILANGASFFSSGHGNLLETGSVFGLTSLAAAVSAMRKQRDANNNDIDIMPAVLAVPPELEVAARSALNSELITATIDSGDAASVPTGNALQNVAQLVVESRLSNTAKFANASTAGWYLFAGPLDAAVIVGFLDGNESPTIEFFGLDHDINTLGVGWRVYHDFGCALGDYRAAVSATGAGGE